MSVVAIERKKTYTVDDLDALPELEGRFYEIYDGELRVSPSPARGHQRAETRLVMALTAVCPADLEVLAGPIDVVLRSKRVFAPDAVVVPAGGEERRVVEPPLLVVEVRSPSTAAFDVNEKKEAYERFGVPAYWIVDPDKDKPSLTVFELRRRRYVEIAHVVGDEAFEATRPFPVTIVPSRLV